MSISVVNCYFLGVKNWERKKGKKEEVGGGGEAFFFSYYSGILVGDNH